MSLTLSILVLELLLFKENKESYILRTPRIKFVRSVSSLLYFVSLAHTSPWNKELFLIIFWCASFGYLYFLSIQLLNEPGLGAGIDPGMALTPFPCSINSMRFKPMTFQSCVKFANH